MNDQPSSSAGARISAGALETEGDDPHHGIPLKDAPRHFCPESTWQTADAWRRLQRIPKVRETRAWFSLTGIENRPVDPFLGSKRQLQTEYEACLSALNRQFRAMLGSVELEADGLPFPSPDGKRKPVPPGLWQVLRIDYHTSSVWDGGARRQPHDPCWRDVRVYPRGMSPDSRAAQQRGTEPPTPASPRDSKPAKKPGAKRSEPTYEVVKQLLRDGVDPGDGTLWKGYPEMVRERTRAMPGGKQARGFSERTLRRYLARAREELESERQADGLKQ